MIANEEMVLHINSSNGEISVEDKVDGVIRFKQISADALLECIKNSIERGMVIKSGLLPKNCIAYDVGDNDFRSVTILHEERYADISYYKSEYLHFPLPKLVFKFNVKMGSRVNSCRIGIVADERLTPNTKMYKYPFSNVSGFNLCLGNNVLPKCESLHTIASLPYQILTIPNNDDMFDPKNNKEHLDYRTLLESLKDKQPSYYYENVLVESGKTLADFIAGI